MTQSGETDSFTAYDHVKAINDHTGKNIIDYCIVNKGVVPSRFLQKYKKENAAPVKPDIAKIEDLGIKVLADNVINTQDHVRHDAEKIAKNIVNLILELKDKGSVFV